MIKIGTVGLLGFRHDPERDPEGHTQFPIGSRKGKVENISVHKSSTMAMPVGEAFLTPALNSLSELKMSQASRLIQLPQQVA